MQPLHSRSRAKDARSTSASLRHLRQPQPIPFFYASAIVGRNLCGKAHRMSSLSLCNDRRYVVNRRVNIVLWCGSALKDGYLGRPVCPMQFEMTAAASKMAMQRDEERARRAIYCRSGSGWSRVPSSPRCSAIETSSASELSRSFCIRLWRCHLMVRSAVPSLSAICLFSFPQTPT